MRKSAVEQQGSFWPEERSSDVAAVSWSHSRRSVLEQCARRYYYEYFGSSTRLARTDPQKAHLARLKRLQNRHERAGTILHLAIASYLRASRKEQAWDEERVLRWATAMLADDRKFSESDPDGVAPPARRFPPVLLREYHYRETSAGEKLDEVESRLTAALHAFFTAPVFAEFRNAGVQADALIETRLNLAGLPCRITGQIDLAYRRGERFTVVDWKMGTGGGSGDDSLQLAVYALWAHTVHGIPVDALAVYKAHLGSESLQAFRVTDRLLASARVLVLQDAERMAYLAPYGVAGFAEAFTPNPHVKVCGSCAYQRLCPGGRRFLSD